MSSSWEGVAPWSSANAASSMRAVGIEDASARYERERPCPILRSSLQMGRISAPFLSRASGRPDPRAPIDMSALLPRLPADNGRRSGLRPLKRSLACAAALAARLRFAGRGVPVEHECLDGEIRIHV